MAMWFKAMLQPTNHYSMIILDSLENNYWIILI